MANDASARDVVAVRLRISDEKTGRPIAGVPVIVSADALEATPPVEPKGGRRRRGMISKDSEAFALAARTLAR
jgi:hypothetical protein